MSEKINYVLRISHRPILAQSADAKHAEYLHQQTALPDAWRIKDADFLYCVLPPIKGNLSQNVTITKYLGKGIKGSVGYKLRSPNYLDRDEAVLDDTILIEFNPEKLDFQELVQKAVPIFISAFAAYRVEIFSDGGFFLTDIRALKTMRKELNKDIDGRDSVYRIYPIMYWDRELCRRAFNLTPEIIVERLQGKVEDVYLHEDGVYLLYTSQVLFGDVLKAVDAQVRAWMGVKVEAK